MNTVCIKDVRRPEIKLFIPAGNYNLPQHLVEQIQAVNYGVNLARKNLSFFQV